MSISDIYKGTTSGTCLAGKVDTGFVEINQKLLIKPANEVVTVKCKYRFNPKKTLTILTFISHTEFRGQHNRSLCW